MSNYDAAFTCWQMLSWWLQLHRWSWPAGVKLLCRTVQSRIKKKKISSVKNTVTADYRPIWQWQRCIKVIKCIFFVFLFGKVEVVYQRLTYMTSINNFQRINMLSSLKGMTDWKFSHLVVKTLLDITLSYSFIPLDVCVKFSQFWPNMLHYIIFDVVLKHVTHNHLWIQHNTKLADVWYRVDKL